MGGKNGGRPKGRKERMGGKKYNKKIKIKIKEEQRRNESACHMRGWGLVRLKRKLVG